MSSFSPSSAPGSAGHPPPADRWQQASPEVRRTLIVEAALDLLQARDLSAITMRSVAAALGVGTMTLYTYVDGQHGLHREMVRRGFEMLSCHADEAGTPTCAEDWLAGGRRYLQFAMDRPNLYKLMFDHPMEPSDRELLLGGFEPYLDCVTKYLVSQGLTDADTLSLEARRRAGRWWVALHGLAMLALAGRLCVLEGDLDDLLRDLLPRVGPM